MGVDHQEQAAPGALSRQQHAPPDKDGSAIVMTNPITLVFADHQLELQFERMRVQALRSTERFGLRVQVVQYLCTWWLMPRSVIWMLLPLLAVRVYTLQLWPADPTHDSLPPALLRVVHHSLVCALVHILQQLMFWRRQHQLLWWLIISPIVVRMPFLYPDLVKRTLRLVLFHVALLVVLVDLTMCTAAYAPTLPEGKAALPSHLQDASATPVMPILVPLVRAAWAGLERASLVPALLLGHGVGLGAHAQPLEAGHGAVRQCVQTLGFIHTAAMLLLAMPLAHRFELQSRVQFLQGLDMRLRLRGTQLFCNSTPPVLRRFLLAMLFPAILACGWHVLGIAAAALVRDA